MWSNLTTFHFNSFKVKFLWQITFHPKTLCKTNVTLGLIFFLLFISSGLSTFRGIDFFYESELGAELVRKIGIYVNLQYKKTLGIGLYSQGISVKYRFLFHFVSLWSSLFNMKFMPNMKQSSKVVHVCSILSCIPNASLKIQIVDEGAPWIHATARKHRYHVTP